MRYFLLAPVYLLFKQCELVAAALLCDRMIRNSANLAWDIPVSLIAKGYVPGQD